MRKYSRNVHKIGTAYLQRVNNLFFYLLILWDQLSDHYLKIYIDLYMNIIKIKFENKGMETFGVTDYNT